VWDVESFILPDELLHQGLSLDEVQQVDVLLQLLKGGLEHIFIEEFPLYFRQEVFQITEDGNIDGVEFFVFVEFLCQLEFIVEVKDGADTQGADQHEH
jgi:hypothetical protein